MSESTGRVGDVSRTSPTNRSRQTEDERLGSAVRLASEGVKQAFGEKKFIEKRKAPSGVILAKSV